MRNRNFVYLLALLFFLVSTSVQARGMGVSKLIGSDSSSVRQVRPGVVHRFILDQRGPWQIHILEIDLTQPDLEIGCGRALDGLFGREQTSSIAKRQNTANRRVIAALNSDFFSLKTGENENNNIIEGEFVKGTRLTGSPFDVFDNIHSQFGISNDKRPLIDRFEFDGAVIWKTGERSDLLGVNDVQNGRSIVLFNKYYGASTPTDTLKMAIQELPLFELGIHSDTLIAVVSGDIGAGGLSILKGSLVLSGYNLPPGNPLSQSKQGDTVKLWLGLRPNRGSVRTLVGGWPRIVLDGKNIASGADYAEGTFPRFSAGRHPRSGVGFSRDSTKVFFIAVDGRTQMSVGMSLVEFADLMLASGVYQGMNFDGGGSTTLVIDGKIVNAPSDASGERPVGNCLLLFERTRK
jgi:hypothetical protein